MDGSRDGVPHVEDGALGDAACVRADRRTHARARAGGDGGVPDPARVEPGVAGVERDGGRGTGAVGHAVLDGGQGRRRRELPAHPDAARWIGRLAQSSLGAGAGGATPLGDSCSQAPVAAVTAKSPYTNNYLAPGSACPEGVNIRCKPSHRYWPTIPKPRLVSAPKNRVASTMGA